MNWTNNYKKKLCVYLVHKNTEVSNMLSVKLHPIPCRVFHEKSMAAHLVMKFSLFHSWNPRVHYNLIVQHSTISRAKYIQWRSTDPISFNFHFSLISGLFPSDHFYLSVKHCVTFWLASFFYDNGLFAPNPPLRQRTNFSAVHVCLCNVPATILHL